MFIRVDSSHLIDRFDVGSIDLDYEVVVISDYNKGFLGEEDIQYICERHDTVFFRHKKDLRPMGNRCKVY